VVGNQRFRGHAASIFMIGASETLVFIHLTTQRKYPENHDFHSLPWEHHIMQNIIW